MLQSNAILENNEPLGRYIVRYVQLLNKQKAEIAIMLQLANSQVNSNNLAMNSLSSMLNFYNDTQGIHYLEQIRTIILNKGEGQDDSLINCITNQYQETINYLDNALSQRILVLRQNNPLPVQVMQNQPQPVGLAQVDIGFFANNGPNNNIDNNGYNYDDASSISTTLL